MLKKRGGEREMIGKTVHIKEADGILASLEQTFKSFPKLPKGLVDFFVTIAPWVALIGGVLLLVVVGILGVIGLIASVIATVVTFSPQYLIMMILTLGIAIIEGYLLLMAFKPLQAKALSGWRMMAYVELLSVVTTILTLSVSGIIWGLLWNAVGFYILFQMKHHYK